MLTVASPSNPVPSIVTPTVTFSREGFGTGISTVLAECAAQLTSIVLSDGGGEAWTSIEYQSLYGAV